MKKIVVEKMVFEIGDIIDLGKATPIFGTSWGTKKNIMDKASKALVYKLTLCNAGYFLYHTLTDTGNIVRFKESEVEECEVIRKVDLKGVFEE